MNQTETITRLPIPLTETNFTTKNAAQARLEYVLWRTRGELQRFNSYTFWLYGDWYVRPIAGEVDFYYMVKTPESDRTFLVTPDIEAICDFIREHGTEMIAGAFD